MEPGLSLAFKTNCFSHNKRFLTDELGNMRWRYSFPISQCLNSSCLCCTACLTLHLLWWVFRLVEKPNGKHRRHSQPLNQCKRRIWWIRGKEAAVAWKHSFPPPESEQAAFNEVNNHKLCDYHLDGGCRFNHPIHQTVTLEEHAKVNCSDLNQSHISALQAFSTFILLFWSSRQEVLYHL